MEIARVENDDELRRLHEYLYSIMEGISNGTTVRVRVAIDIDGVKFKVNERVWSPGIGTKGN